MAVGDITPTAMFLLAHSTGTPLYLAMQLFTLNPAKAVSLEGDRGSLEIGKRADLITVHDDGTAPRLISILRQGQRVT